MALRLMSVVRRSCVKAYNGVHFLETILPPLAVPLLAPPIMSTPAEITLPMIRQAFTSAVVSDALDAEGFPRQSPRLPLKQLTTSGVLIGRCKTTLWAEMAHSD